LGQLPATLRQELDRLLDGHSRRDLADRSRAISAQYRARSGSDGVVRSENDALAYVAARMPATYAAMAFALEQLALAAPDLRPQSLLDVGCGPGTAAIAALDAYPNLESLELFDRNIAFLAVATKLLEACAGERKTGISTGDITWGDSLPFADLIVAGYVFAELHASDLRERARMLWWGAKMALVITEPGTPDGFERIRNIRDTLIAEGAHVAAPCTHHGACLMTGGDWCRVPVRVQRSRDHRELKRGALGYEDEPVAYLALTRARPEARATHRIVGRVLRGKAGLRLRACGSVGIANLSIPVRDKEKFKQFKRLDWGDAASIPTVEAQAESPD
jgi:ribosomal protein RSM22 (predicted rRNA methylase)